MTRLFLTVLLLAAAPTSAQVHYSAGVLGGFRYVDTSSETSVGVNAAGGWGRLLGQVRIAEVTRGRSEYRVATDRGFVTIRNDYTTFGVGADAQIVQRVAGPVSATFGAGVTLTRYGGSSVTVDGVERSRWSSAGQLLPGVLIGPPGRVRIQARLSVPLPPYPVNRSQAQVGVLVPIR